MWVLLIIGFAVKLTSCAVSGQVPSSSTPGWSIGFWFWEGSEVTAEAQDLPIDAIYMQAESSKTIYEFLSNNSERVYFNDTLWDGFQNHALTVNSDARLTRDERERFVSGERDLRDVQEERWRAFLMLNEIVDRAGKTPLGRKSARLALRCLRGIAAQRFGREEAIQQADVRLSNWLRR